MYKLIIADDEKIIREGIAQMVNWRDLGFEITGTFSEGEEVIDCLDSMPVDVVLTDIMMPRIGGIDIARYVYENKISCKIVFISGHKEFDFAWQAIKYGVKDYILKPSKVEEICTVFHKIKQELDNNLKDVEFQKRTKEQWLEMYPVLEEKFLSNLIMGALNDREKIRQRMMLLYPEIEAEHCPCFSAELEVKDYDNFIRSRWKYGAEQFDDAVYKFVRFFKGSGFLRVVYKRKGIMRLFGIMKKYGVNRQENQEMCVVLTEEFHRTFMEIFGVEIVLEIKANFENIYQVAGAQMSYVQKADAKWDKEELLLHEQKKLILTNIITGNISMSQKIMKTVMKNEICGDIQYCKDFVVDLFSALGDSLKEYNYQLYRVFQPHVDYRVILNMSTIAEIEVYCERIFGMMKSKDINSGQDNRSSMVNRIKNYVQEHICEDIVLENVSNEMFISVSHLSRIFKLQTGETFQQYVIRKKMEKAAELLHDPQYKVYQVAEYLGYKTPYYFSKVFYNIMGVNPTQYRKEVLMMGDANEELVQI